jgi:hypothetical protein
MFKAVGFSSLCWARWILFTPFILFSKIHFNIVPQLRLRPQGIFSFQVFRLYFTFLFLVVCLVLQLCHVVFRERTKTKVPEFEKEYKLRSSSFFNFIHSSLRHHCNPHCVELGHHHHLPTQTSVNEDYSLLEHGSVVIGKYAQMICRTALLPSSGYSKKLKIKTAKLLCSNVREPPLNMGAKRRCIYTVPIHMT